MRDVVQQEITISASISHVDQEAIQQLVTATNLADGTYTVTYDDGITTGITVNLIVLSSGTISGLSAGTYDNITVSTISASGKQ